MNINNAFPSKWLKSGDITGDDLILTIREVRMENIGQGENTEVKPVVYFDETEKGLVLNKTNASTISQLHTPETNSWVGKRIALFSTEVDFAGKQTLALRVRMRIAANASAPLTTGNGGAKLAHDPVTQFWALCGERGLIGKDILAQHGGDFNAALKSIQT